ncbi:YrvL family regulatory protein [Terrisporobacter sp.]
MTKLKFKNILSLIFLFIIGYIILFLFGGTLLSILGLKYNSIGSLAKFIAIYYVISLPIEFVIFSFFKIFKVAKNLSNLEYYAIFFFADIPVSMVLIGMVEYFMKDVSCSMMTAFLFSIICFLVNMCFDLKLNSSNKDDKDNEKKAA